MATVAASLLSADFSQLGKDARRALDSGCEWLHYDVMDGVFVPNISFGIPVLASLSKAVPAVYDVHLMITNPLPYIAEFAKAGADYITVHFESEGDTTAAIDAIHAAGCKAGVSIKPGTSAEDIYPFLPKLDMVLIMTVEPGFGGQKFNADMVSKIADIKNKAAEQGLSVLVEVDGGINAETGATCTQAGANVLVAGSYVFGAKDINAAVSSLKTLKEV